MLYAGERPARQPEPSKKRIDVQNGFDVRGKAIQSVVALRRYAKEIGRRGETDRRSRGANEGVTERIAIEEAVQIRADDESVFADGAVGRDIGRARAKDLAERLTAFEIA